jgi:dTDP-4-dehydrorhamnose reductase
MAYISTNEVFDGLATAPYPEWHPLRPINPYGASKAAGEWYVRHLLTRFYIVRTAWLFDEGGRNFPHKIVQLAGQVRSGKRDLLRVVEDEVGNPTYVPDLACAIADLIKTCAYGPYHLVGDGFCSRFELAQELLRLSGHADVPIQPIRSTEFERASCPPAFAPLANVAADALGIRLPHWRDAMARFLQTA